jgi:hypothetical protein
MHGDLLLEALALHGSAFHNACPVVCAHHTWRPSVPQWFWFMPNELLWKATFKRQQPLTQEEVQQVLASSGPDQDTPLPGAFLQQTVQSAGTGVAVSTSVVYQVDPI